MIIDIAIAMRYRSAKKRPCRFGWLSGECHTMSGYRGAREWRKAANPAMAPDCKNLPRATAAMTVTSGQAWLLLVLQDAFQDTAGRSLRERV